MNDLTEKLVNNYTARMALVIYASDDNWHNAYLESHVINEKGQMLEGKPLLQETIQGLVDVFFDERKNRTSISGIIPSNLLCYDVLPGGNYRMMWYRPAERRVLHFKGDLHLPSGEAWAPAMLYLSEGRNLYVFALPDDNRPDENTKLLIAPYHNVDTHGNVCLGSAKVKKPNPATYSALMKYWEDMFWLSEFTHITGNDSLVKGNLNMIWKNLIENPSLKWDQLDELLPSPLSFKKLFR